MLHVRREARQRLGIGACARGIARLARGRVHERADHARDHEEHDQREHVLVFFDRELMKRRREVVVRAQEREDRGADREKRPARRRGRDHKEEKQQQHRRQRALATRYWSR